MTTAVVLSGGSSLGAAQVGMLRAVLEAGVRVDMFVGTSVGALNAAWAAADPTVGGVEVLDRIWRGLARRDVFPTAPWHGLLAMAGRRPSMVPDAALRALLHRHLRFSRLEYAAVALHVVAADVATGCDALFSAGPAVPALLASSAIPGLLPPAQIDGHFYADGGLVSQQHPDLARRGPGRRHGLGAAGRLPLRTAGTADLTGRDGTARAEPAGPAPDAGRGAALPASGRPADRAAAVPGRALTRGLLRDRGPHRPGLRHDATLAAPRARPRRARDAGATPAPATGRARRSYRSVTNRVRRVPRGLVSVR